MKPLQIHTKASYWLKLQSKGSKESPVHVRINIISPETTVVVIPDTEDRMIVPSFL